MSKRSASKAPEGPIYFTDRSFGPTETSDVVRILRAGGMSIEPHGVHFPENEAPPEDPEWLALCAERGWVALSTDKDIKTLSHAAVHGIMTHGGRAFFCVGKKHPFPRLAQNVVNAQHKMARFVHKHRRLRAWIGRVYMQTDTAKYDRGVGGSVDMWLTYDEWVEQRR